MNEVFVKVYLFDPLTNEEFEVNESIEVEIAKLLNYNPAVSIDSLKLKFDKRSNVFKADLKKLDYDNSYYFRVGFAKRNFSKLLQKLLSPEEVNPSLLPIYLPSRIPYWDSGWDDKYDSNEFFSNGKLKQNCSKAEPLKLRIPLRQFFIIGHRGAPYYYPENTLASFRKALELGANGLELDICFTKDKKIVVFHDAIPTKHPSQFDRTIFEDLPYELVSPEFTKEGKYAFIKKYKNGELKTERKIKLRNEHHFDIANLTLKELQNYYLYKRVNEKENQIIEFDEFLAFAAGERDRLRLLYLDVKNPDWSLPNDQKKYELFGKRIAEYLAMFDKLPVFIVVSNPDKDILKVLKKSIADSSENRCSFAYDAEGSFGSILGIKDDPLKVARQMENEVVSIGSLARPGNLDEVNDSVRDRDYNSRSNIKQVIHWTLNEKAQMAHSIVAGVNGILTDKPDLLDEVLQKSFKTKVS